ncbi:hypothetical protein [Pontibacter harenae]|uniref:hypothetical protein n=1 Tax=Pontibacter harenae TaxID=2894083 RepID=UPI001E3E7162|nr:hypothetical protein [Pontibacter harenae]MCC9166792.1 hypothetical protein [Pontibacter harenae]
MAEEISSLTTDKPEENKTEIKEKRIITIEAPAEQVPDPTTLTVSASIYFPEPQQTDSSPFITADGSRINKKNPGKHRWIAVSRDLHSRWGGEISYGDSVKVSGISDQLDGTYIVRDVMNRRMRNQIDILVGKNDDVMGYWRDVEIAKL